MTETPLRAAYDKAAEDFRKNSRALVGLGTIAAAVRDMRDEGMDVSFEARPRAYGCQAPLTKDEGVAANGTIMIGGVKVEFKLDNWAYFYLGGQRIGEQYLYDREQNAEHQKGVRDILLNARAEIEAVSACSLQPESGDVLDKGRPGLKV
jgi:hypothetical protein